MASYLGEYKGAASKRIDKFNRAVKSVIDQTYKNWELIIVADGCSETIIQLKKYTDERIKLIVLEKQKLWSGNVRNAGIEAATGDYIMYLDTDDIFGATHLQFISGAIAARPDADWYFMNDFCVIDDYFQERFCSISLGNCGTSNIVHPKNKVRWLESDGYAHDWNFIKALRKWSLNYKHIGSGEYCVCHIPNQTDI